MADESAFDIKARILIETQNFEKAINEAVESLGSLAEEINKISTGTIDTDVSDLKSSLGDAEDSVEDFGDSFEDTGNKISSGLENWGINLNKFYEKGNSIFKNFGIDIDQFASHFGVEGKVLAGITATVVALEKLGEKVQAMTSNIAKGTGAIGDELTKLKDTANNTLVNGVGRSMDEVGVMIADLNTRFGYTGEQLEKMTDEFDKFAKVTNSNVKTSINSMADVIYKWNVGIENTSAVMNQFTRASQLSGAGVDELMSTVKSSQSVFSKFKMSLTDSIAFTANLSKQGIDASNAIFGMRQALAKFSVQGVDAAQGFAEVSKRIQESKSETEALNIAIDTFGTRSGPEMLRVLRNSSDEFDNLKKALMESGTAIADTEEASRTVSDSIEDLKATLMGTFGGFGEGISNIFRDIIDTVSTLIRQISPIIKPIADIFSDVFSYIGKVIKTLVENIIALKDRFRSTFEAVGAILTKVRDFFRKMFGDVLKTIQNVFGLIFDIIDGKWESAWERTKNILMRALKIILDMISMISNAFIVMINGILEGINWAINGYNKLAEKLNWDKLDKISLLEDVDISEVTGLTKAIEESDKRIEELSGKTAQKITGDIGQVVDATLDLSDAELKLSKQQEQVIEEESELAKITKTQLKSAFTNTFKTIGEQLIEGGSNYKAYAQIAVNSISEILNGLAEQLMAQAAVNLATGDFVGAAVAGAGAAAAFAASGALSAVVSKMSAVANSTNNANTSIEKFKQTLKSISESRFTSTGTITLGLEEINNELDILREKQSKLYSENKNFLDRYTREEVADYLAISSMGFSASSEWGVDKKEWKRRLQIYDEYNNTLNLINQAEKELDEALKNVNQTLKDSVKENKDIIDSYKDFYGATVLIADSAGYQFKKYSTYIEMIKEEQKIGLQELEADVYDTFKDFGQTIGEAMYNSFAEGTGKQEFFNSIKSTIRETVLKMAIYTESFTERLSEVGAKLVSALMGGEDLEQVTKTISDIYDDVAEVAQRLENNLDNIFEKIEEKMGFVTSQFAKNMKSFKETIKDVTGDIGTTFINGLTEGITQSDFLGNIKDWLRKMMIQMVVYTDTMKSEIEEIGKRISAGITQGFTDTDLHEIRRDMSYMFEEATKKVQTIDSLLGGVFGGYATGTNNATRGLAMVGESGPELVKFNGGEQVLNNANTQKALNNMSGTTINQTVNFNNLKDTTAFAMMQQFKTYNRQMAINGII